MGDQSLKMLKQLASLLWTDSLCLPVFFWLTSFDEFGHPSLAAGFRFHKHDLNLDRWFMGINLPWISPARYEGWIVGYFITMGLSLKSSLKNGLIVYLYSWRGGGLALGCLKSTPVLSMICMHLYWVIFHVMDKKFLEMVFFSLPSRELTYPQRIAFWRWLSELPRWDMWSFPGGYFIFYRYYPPEN